MPHEKEAGWDSSSLLPNYTAATVKFLPARAMWTGSAVSGGGGHVDSVPCLRETAPWTGYAVSEGGHVDKG